MKDSTQPNGLFPFSRFEHFDTLLNEYLARRAANK